MIYAIIENNSNGLYIGAFNNVLEYMENVNFTNVAWIVDTNEPPKGETYDIKKSRLRQKAYNFKELKKFNPGLNSYCCMDNIADYFYRYGKRYGLLKEFKENHII